MAEQTTVHKYALPTDNSLTAFIAKQVPAGWRWQGSLVVPEDRAGYVAQNTVLELYEGKATVYGKPVTPFGEENPSGTFETGLPLSPVRLGQVLSGKPAAALLVKDYLGDHGQKPALDESDIVGFYLEQGHKGVVYAVSREAPVLGLSDVRTGTTYQERLGLDTIRGHLALRWNPEHKGSEENLRDLISLCDRLLERRE